MSEVLEVSGIRDIHGKAITLIEGPTALQVDNFGGRTLNAAQCRRLALQLHRCARRLDALATSRSQHEGASS